MNRKLLATVILPACIALQVGVQLSGVPAFGQSTFGEIRGATENRSGLPLPEVQVAVHSVEENTDRTVVSGADGTFAFENLKPGHYQLTARKEGFGSSPAATVELAAGQSLHNDITLTSPNGFKTLGEAASPTVTENSDRTSLTEREKQLLDRIDRLEQRLAALEAKGAKEPTQTAASTQPAPATPPDRGSTQTVVATQLVPAPPDKRTTPTAAPTQPVLLASLDKAAGLQPAEKPNALSITPVPGTRADAKTTPGTEPTVASLNPAAIPQPAQANAPPAHVLPEALEAPEATTAPNSDTVYSYADFTWLNGTPRNKDTVLDTKFFTPEVRFDTHFMDSLNQPKDHTMGGATESFRSGEFQVEQASVGGDFHWQNVRGRILTMFGLFGATTPRNDASSGVGQWDVRTAYRYVSEAYGGYHFNVNRGLNVDAGIFVSYIGLFSYYNFDNWTYQPSYVSSNTPWFFNGLRIQWFPTKKLKIEPWIINGWQTYNLMNQHHGFGGQILYRPKEWWSMVFNNYGNGTDTLGVPGRSRIHTDDSLEIRYYNRPASQWIDKMAFSLTGDLGCEYGGGVSCSGNHKGGPKQAFLGWMLYDRVWWGKDKYGLTYGGGKMNNPGRYLTLLPPIDGADAVSGSPYFTANPGQPAHMWDTTLTFQWMPREYITWWAEAGYRHSDIPYFTGRQGITPPGGNNGSPQYYTCMSGTSAGTSDLGSAEAACGGGLSSVWFPDLRKTQGALSVGVMVKF